jgi:hypothetical protein
LKARLVPVNPCEGRFNYMATRRKSQKKKSGGIFEFTRIAFGVESYGKRQFKRDLKKLKKAGLLSSKVDINLQDPTKYMLSQIRKFKAVLQGTAKTIEIPRAEKEYYKNAGYPVKSHAAIVEAPKGARVKRLPSENGIPRVQVTQRGQGGTKTSVRTMVPYTDLESYIINKVMHQAPLKKGQSYAFRFYGNNSTQHFYDDDPSMRNARTAKEKLIENVLKYDAVKYDEKHGTRPDNPDSVYRNFETVTIRNRKDLDAWDAERKETRAKNRSERSKANNEKYNRWRRERYAKMDELEKREYNERRRESKESHAARERVRRAAIARSEPEKYLAEKAAAKARKQKSRAKAKASKK